MLNGISTFKFNAAFSPKAGSLSVLGWSLKWAEMLAPLAKCELCKTPSTARWWEKWHAQIMTGFHAKWTPASLEKNLRACVFAWVCEFTGHLMHGSDCLTWHRYGLVHGRLMSLLYQWAHMIIGQVDEHQWSVEAPQSLGPRRACWADKDKDLIHLSPWAFLGIVHQD